MEAIIGTLLILSGSGLIARAILKRHRKPAYHYFAQTSQQCHELQRRRKR